MCPPLPLFSSSLLSTRVTLPALTFLLVQKVNRKLERDAVLSFQSSWVVPEITGEHQEVCLHSKQASLRYQLTG